MSGRKGNLKKSQYYVWYLGWKEVRGVWGREFTEPITRELIVRRQYEDLPKLTIEVSRKELKVVQLIENKKGKVEKIKYPPIPAKDVTYAVQALSPDEDVVSCIYLGFNPQTRCAVHVHVYRCDSPETADLLAQHLNMFTELPEHQERTRKIETELVAKGQIVPRPSAFVGHADDDDDDDASTTAQSLEDVSLFDNRMDLYESHAIDRARQHERDRDDFQRLSQIDREREHEEDIYVHMTAELKKKLKAKGDTPILMPPKDYDTIHRSAGNIITSTRRPSLDVNIIGPDGTVIKGHRDSSLAEDSARGDSENGSHHGSKDSRSSGSGKQRIPRDYYKDQRGLPRNSYDGPSRDSYDDKRDSYRSRDSSQYEESLENGENDAPRRKPASQKYAPPTSPKPRRPTAGPYKVMDSPRNPRGPNPGPNPSLYAPPVSARPTSPPPELRDSYFPGTGLPGYLERNPYDRSPRGSPNIARRGFPEGGKKYTAASLGLADYGDSLDVPDRGYPHQGAVRTHSAPWDEGYRSLDRNERPLVAENPYEHYPPYGRRPEEYPPEVAMSMPDMYKRGPPNRRLRREGDELPPEYMMRGMPY